MLISLRLVHPSEDINELAKALPFEVGAAWNKGDIWNKNISHRYREDYYRALNLESYHTINQTVNALCGALDRLEEKFKAIWFDLFFKKNLYCTLDVSASIDAANIRRLAQWGIALDLDIYLVNDLRPQNERNSPNMKNIQVIGAAPNTTYDIFAATEAEFKLVFSERTDIAFIDEIYANGDRVTIDKALNNIWRRRLRKSDAKGINGIIFYQLEFKKINYPTRRDEEAVNIDESYLL